MIGHREGTAIVALVLCYAKMDVAHLRLFGSDSR